jgi:uncharacterized membrane protein (UPF0127 family)
MHSLLRSTVLLLLIVAAVAPGQVTARPLNPPWIPETPFSSETATVTIDGHVVDAEIADTGTLRERGLSYRDGLELDTGMLFVYSDESVRSFWMFEMRFCLDMLWITDGKLVGAAEDACPAESAEDEIPRFRSPEPVQYVLEVEAGWLAEHDVDVGASVELELPATVATSYAVTLGSADRMAASRRRWFRVSVRSPRVRSRTPRSWSVVRRRPPVMASGKSIPTRTA